MPAHTHTHDHIDWAARVFQLRQVDELHAAAFADIAVRLTGSLPGNPTVVDVGSGAGGMSRALAAVLAQRGGGTLLLVDAVPELLAVAAEIAGTGAADPAAALGEPGGSDAPRPAAAAGGAGARTADVAGKVEIVTIRADLAGQSLSELVPAADLIWAASMVHHLPDQQAGVSSFAAALAPGGILAIAEGGLETQTLPWDLGVGRPGLERRLRAARDDAFGEMRNSMDGSVRMPYGWTSSLAQAGLREVSSFSSLIDHPAPTTAPVRDYVIRTLGDLAELLDERITDEDREAVHKLLDPAGPDYLGRRDDLYVLGTRTIHFGRR